MGVLADQLNRYALTGESCEWCEAEIVLDRDTGEFQCDCWDKDELSDLEAEDAI